MRPINLNISAFGPYAGKVEIEFDKFLDKGIYLISGNTGAGKSTIFEAIKFALYGEENGEVRSKYASGDVPTYVAMTFLLHGK
ncbi:MAG: AAA family ATPase, partial [Lachnospiraceae bacterium]|nr:AAA family ATPase [Lachnospiraceae bacterium]